MDAMTASSPFLLTLPYLVLGSLNILNCRLFSVIPRVEDPVVLLLPVAEVAGDLVGAPDGHGRSQASAQVVVAPDDGKF